MTALENVALPLSYRGVGRREALLRAKAMLEQVGLRDRSAHRPADLSGGQRQRVAIARALVGQPSLILADEPTGNLDHQTAHDIMDLLLSLNREHGTTLVVVTHDAAIARRLDRQIRVIDAVVQEDRLCLA
jgi:putative ABC transport system ATP-binding protein